MRGGAGVAAAMRNLGSSEASSNDSSASGSGSSSSGGGDGVSGGGGPSNRDWTSPAASVMKEVDAVISSVTSEGGSVMAGGWMVSSSTLPWNLLVWSRYFHLWVGR